MALKIKDYIDEFPNSITLDFDRKEVTIIRNKKFKVYNKQFFDKITKIMKEVDMYELSKQQKM